MRRAFPLLFAFVLIGCQGADEEVMTETARPSRSIAEGKVDSQLVGKWRAKDPNGEFNMDLTDQGGYTIVSKVKTQGGMMDSKVDGKWSTKSNELLMERNGPDGKPFTVVYRWVLDDKGLLLSSDGSKVKYRYQRQ
jgi:hypothetical protein